MTAMVVVTVAMVVAIIARCQRRVPVMNCSFDNPKSSGFFPRSYNEEECGRRRSQLYGDTGGMILWEIVWGLSQHDGPQCEDCSRTKENRLKCYSLF